MKKNLILSLLLICFTGIALAQEQRPQLQILDWEQSGDDVNRNVGISVITHQFFNDKWPREDGKDCAWIRVHFQNMPDDEIRDLEYDFGQVAYVSQRIDRLTDDRSIWLFVKPAEIAYMEVSSKKYGHSNRLPNITIEPKRAYDVTVKNDKTVTINIKTIPEEGVSILFDGKAGHTSPCNITDVPLGRHHIVLSLKGKQVKDEWVEVSEANTLFDYDLRKTYTITITSEPSEAKLFVDGHPQGRTPQTISVFEGSHHIETRTDDGQSDFKDFTIDDATQRDYAVIKTKPVKTKEFVVASYYGKGNNPIESDLTINGNPEGKGQKSYTLNRKLGEELIIRMSYYGNYREKRVTVKENMKSPIDFLIKDRKGDIWPFNVGYKNANFGWDFNYVNKQYSVRNPETKKTESVNVLYEDRSMHGFQTGLRYQPAFDFGLGLYTGLYYEFYYTSSDELYNQGYYNKWMEHNLYVPVHAQYIFPLREYIGFTLHGGIGMDLGLTNSLGVTESGYDSETGLYGDGSPKRFNLSAEVGVTIRIKRVQINAQYSFGLTNHEFVTDYSTKQRKLTAGIAILFGEMY